MAVQFRLEDGRFVRFCPACSVAIHAQMVEVDAGERQNIDFTPCDLCWHRLGILHLGVQGD